MFWKIRPECLLSFHNFSQVVISEKRILNSVQNSTSFSKLSEFLSQVPFESSQFLKKVSFQVKLFRKLTLFLSHGFLCYLLLFFQECGDLVHVR